ncbi:MAG: T9SS type A sorting domain-containing protein [Rhodothermaceae bacterium]|nr:T9SS type A sorting domain-containing protein [Rhodothermaceae bacterium]
MTRDFQYPSSSHQSLKVLFAFLLTFMAYTPFISFASIPSSTPALHSPHVNSPTVRIDTVSVRTGDTFQLALKTSDLSGAGISSFNVVISYNASLLTATDVTIDSTLSGSDGAAMTLVTNLDTPGVIKMAAAGAIDLTGSGDLVIMTFQSLSTEGSSSIKITDFTFNEGLPGATLVNGVVHIETQVVGDPSLNGDISAYDASLILQHLVGTSLLTGDAFNAAETTGNGAVSAYDASLILRYTTGAISCFPASASCSASKHDADVDAQLTWQAADAINGSSASLRIDNIQGAIQAVAIDLELTEAAIQELTPLIPADWTLTSAQVDANTYRILLVGTSPLETDSLLSITFNGAPNTIQASYQLNENAYQTIESLVLDETPASYTLDQNYPNPFNPSTTIQYALPEDARVTLTIYDLQGREVEQLVHEVQHAGTHTVVFDASSLASGTYLYKLQTPSYIETRQMQLIK